MFLTRVLRGLLIASGTTLLVAGSLALSRRSGRFETVQRSRNAERATESPGPFGTAEFGQERRDYFCISSTRSKDQPQRWLLQGFGRLHCFLFFDTWQAAMDQATFRLESLMHSSSDLVVVSGLRK